MPNVILSASVPLVLYTHLEKDAEKGGITKAEALRRILKKHYGMKE